MDSTLKTIRSYYDKLAADYERTRFSTSYGQYIDTLEKEIYNKWNKKYSFNSRDFIDLAGGTGRWTKNASMNFDISLEMLKAGFTKGGPQPGRSAVNAEAAQLPLKDSSVGGVICMHAFMHLDKLYIHKTIAEVHRVLKTGGWFIFDFPLQYRKALFGGQKHGPDQWHGATAFRLKEIKDMLAPYFGFQEKAGYLFIPIHRIENNRRTAFLPLEKYLSGWPFYYMASYCMALVRAKK